MSTTTIADTIGAKARKDPNGRADQAIRYDRTKKITSSRRRTKARNAFVGAVAEFPASTVWVLGVPLPFSQSGIVGVVLHNAGLHLSSLGQLFYKTAMGCESDGRQ
jgi:hypothetical protein